MAVSGFFLGGAAEGVQAVNQLEEQRAQRVDATAMDARKLRLGERAQRFNERKDLVEERNKLIDSHVKTIAEAVKDAKAAGNTPEQISALIAPLTDRIQKTMDLTGGNAQPILDRIGVMVTAPTAAQSELGQMKADFKSGLLSQSEYDNRLAKLNSESGGSVMEEIKRKIATGDINTLTPGGRRIYDDSLKGDPLLRSIFSNMIGGEQSTSSIPAPAATPRPVTSLPQVPTGDGAPSIPTFKDNAEFQAARAAGTVEPGQRVSIGGKIGTAR